MLFLGFTNTVFLLSFKISHLVFFLDGGSGLQESLHDVHVSFERGFVQRCPLELDIWYIKNIKSMITTIN